LNPKSDKIKNQNQISEGGNGARLMRIEGRRWPEGKKFAKKNF